MNENDINHPLNRWALRSLIRWVAVFAFLAGMVAGAIIQAVIG